MGFPMRTLSDFNNNGRQILEDLLRQSEWGSAAQALASLTVLAHPDAVAAVCARAVFRMARNTSMKGKICDIPGHGVVMNDDNAGPEAAFLWATGFVRKRNTDLQCNHIHVASGDPAHFTDIRNICFTPAFLAKLTDSLKAEVHRDEMAGLLRYRVFDLYGGYVGPGPAPRKPTGYDALAWAEPVGKGETSASVRNRMIAKLGWKKSGNRLATCVREVGWTFSDFQPDPGLGRLAA